MKRTSVSIPMILCLIVLIPSACAPQSTPSAQSSLVGTSWTLDSFGSAAHQTFAVEGIPTSLVFAPNGQVSGTLGCNVFSGNYMEKTGKLEFGPLASTLMACPDPQMTQEGSAFQVLTGEVSFSLTGNLLTIFDYSGDLALILTRAVN